MGKRIEFDAAAREALRRGVDQLAGAVRVTLGPRGRNVVLDRQDGAPAITNDGLAIARDIELADPFENMGAQLLREAALKTGEVAGDGTTTATVLAHALVTLGLKAVAAGHHPMAVKRGIDHGVSAVVDTLKRRARDVRARADLARIATVSARGDIAAGELVADALERVGRMGVVTVEDGRGMETVLEVVEGVRFERGYLSPYFITSPETMETTLEHPLVLLTDLKLAAARDVVRALELSAEAGRPLVVIAGDVEGEALATLVVNRLRGNLSSVAVRAPESGDRQRAQLDDLATLTGARLIARDLGRTIDSLEAADLGRAARVLVDRDHTTLVQGGGRAAEIRDRIATLERERDEATAEYDKRQLSERLARLRGGIAVLHVGAATELELAERRGRLEDALAAAQAAVEEGVVTGGGVALVRAQAVVKSLDVPEDERIGRDIVIEALEAPAWQIAVNAGEEGAVAVQRIRAGADGWGYNVWTSRYEDLDAAGVLDPVKVTRCALQNAASIGALVLTTDAIVVESEEEEEEGGEGSEE